MSPADILRIYQGSDGAATSALYGRLAPLGPAGAVAVNLFRACKTSERAKLYRGRRYRGAAYERKDWSIGNLADTLSAHAGALGLVWGWAHDAQTPGYPWLLYVELPPTAHGSGGQVSFHTAARREGPDFAGEWDRAVGAGPQRICGWIAALLAAEADAS